MNLQTEISRHEVAGILLAMERRGQFVRSYSKLVRFALDLVKATYGFEELSLEDANRYLASYGGVPVGLSLSADRKVELARERREERMAPQSFGALPPSTTVRELIKMQDKLDEAVRKALEAKEAKAAMSAGAEGEVEDEDEIDPDLEELRAQAAQEQE